MSESSGQISPPPQATPEMHQAAAPVAQQPPQELLEAMRKIGQPPMPMPGLNIAFGGNPMLEKVTSEHIGKALDNAREAAKDSANTADGERKTGERQFYVTVGLAGFVVVAIIFMVCFLVDKLQNQPELLKTVLTVFVTAIPSVAGGFGLGKIKLPSEK